MKKVEWIHSNKMAIDTGLKAFDARVKLISTGNVISDTQVSWYIRPYNETINPVGEKVEPGHLQDFDLNTFKAMPYEVREFIKKVGKTQQVIAYYFFWYSGGTRHDVGWVVTSGHSDDHRLLKKWPGRGYKTAMALNEIIKYITNG